MGRKIDILMNQHPEIAITRDTLHLKFSFTKKLKTDLSTKNNWLGIFEEYCINKYLLCCWFNDRRSNRDRCTWIVVEKNICKFFRLTSISSATTGNRIMRF